MWRVATYVLWTVAILGIGWDLLALSQAVYYRQHPCSDGLCMFWFIVGVMVLAPIQVLALGLAVRATVVARRDRRWQELIDK